MNYIQFRFMLCLILLLTLAPVAGSQAAAPEITPVAPVEAAHLSTKHLSSAPAGPAGSPGISSASVPSVPVGSRNIPASPIPVFSDCAESAMQSTACTSLQVLLLIDDSSSMLYSDPGEQRLEGVRNVLDILAKEYYLPSVDALSRDVQVKLPEIQVALVHFSSQLLHSSGWKTIAPADATAWERQLTEFEADLRIGVDYNQPQATDFHPPFQEAARLAQQLPPPDCARLILLFTDGVPNLGIGNLAGDELTSYMQRLQQEIYQPVFNRSNDLLFVTTFGSDTTFFRYWDRAHKALWEALAQDSADLDPRRVLFVPASELAARMEHIIGRAIGRQVNTLEPLPDSPLRYTTEIPAGTIALRLTYYTDNPQASFSVFESGGTLLEPDEVTIILSGAGSSIQVLEVLNPSPGAYTILTTAAGGTLTRLLRTEPVKPEIYLPQEAVQLLTKNPFGIQLKKANGEPKALTPQMHMQAAVVQGERIDYLELSTDRDTFVTGWTPLTSEPAVLHTCATLVDEQGVPMILFQGPVGELPIDTLTVLSWESGYTCLPAAEEVSVALQIVNSRLDTPAAAAVPVEWSTRTTDASGGTTPAGAVTEVDASRGQYALRFKPETAGEVQFSISATAVVDGVQYPFYEGMVRVEQLVASRQLELTLGSPGKPADALSTRLFAWLHPGAEVDGTQVVIGRRLFDWFGPTAVQIRGRFAQVGESASEAGIDRFSIRLVSTESSPSSRSVSDWASGQNGEAFNTLELESPGVGLYRLVVTDSGQNPICASLADLPAQTLLLVPDFWEYAVMLVLVVALVLITIYLLKTRPKSKPIDQVLLVLIPVFLATLNLFLVFQLLTQTYKKEFTCEYLIDEKLAANQFTLCEGVDFQLGAINVDIPDLHIPGIHLDFLLFRIDTPDIDLVIPAFDVGPLPASPVQVLPGLKPINGPLEELRKLVTWSIVLVFAVVSIVLAAVVTRILDFIASLRTQAGRWKLLTNLSIFLAFFVIFCTLFYTQVN